MKISLLPVFCCHPKYIHKKELYIVQKKMSSLVYDNFFSCFFSPCLFTSYEEELTSFWDNPAHVSKFYCNPHSESTITLNLLTKLPSTFTMI